MLDMYKEQIVKDLFSNTSLTIEEIAEQALVHYTTAWKLICDSFTKEERSARKKLNYRKSRIGSLNPSYGKKKEEAFRWSGGVVEDGKGYLMVYKPDWYTGRKGSRHVFQHTVVMCEALGITELPKGWVIHHIDGDKKNNDINNLALLTNSAHLRLHAIGRCNDHPERE